MIHPYLPDDLIWTAFQYAADELPEPMVRRFEEQLACDQQAREALAVAVSLSTTIRSAESQEVSEESKLVPASIGDPARYAPGSNAAGEWPVWRHRLVGIGFGAAACLALTFAFSSRPGSQPADEREATPPVAQSPAAVVSIADEPLLAALFDDANADGDAADADAASPVVAPLAVVAGDDTADELFEADELPPLDDVAAPDWLLAAVAEADAVVGRNQ